MVAVGLGVLACAIWLYLLLFRGGFWLARERDAAGPAAQPSSWPSIVAIVPARDEADSIGACVTALLQQDYVGSFSIIVVDDGSTDDTAGIARSAAIACGAEYRLRVLRAPSPRAGWTGKLAALDHGIAEAERFAQAPVYLLLTDADILHAPDSLTQLVARAEQGDLRLVSSMAKLRCSSFAECAFVPAFVFFFAMLYPFGWVNRRDRTTAAAAGGCLLVHRATLREAGGVAAVRHALIDDCALARLMKARGPISLVLTDRVRSIRPYETLGDVRRMVARSAYAQLRYSPLLLVVTVAAMSLTFLVPPVLAVFGSGAARAFGVVAWAQMALAFQPTMRFYRVSPWSGVALPAIAGAYVAFTLDSAWEAARGRAGLWKGRVHANP